MNDDAELVRRTVLTQLFTSVEIDGHVQTEDAHQLRKVGLPIAIADWFSAAQRVRVQELSNGLDYLVLGSSPQGDIGIDSHSSAVVLVDLSGDVVLINSSLDAFLRCALEWLEAVDAEFIDFERQGPKFAQIDPNALSDPDGTWSLMVEEATNGLY